MSEYRRMIDLVEFYEKMLKEQAGVVAIQEKMLSKTTNLLFMKIANDSAHMESTEKVWAQAIEDEVYERVERGGSLTMNERWRMFTNEPYGLYGGSFLMKAQDT